MNYYLTYTKYMLIEAVTPLHQLKIILSREELVQSFRMYIYEFGEKRLY